jgi:hypothetical protein
MVGVNIGAAIHGLGHDYVSHGTAYGASFLH